MSSPSSILCFGHDPILVETRQQIFERAGFACQIALSRQELERCFEQFAVDVLVICHSVPCNECEEAKQIAHSQPDPTLILVLDKDAHNCATEGKDATFDSRQGPKDLLKTITALLQQRSESQLPRHKLPFARAFPERKSVSRRSLENLPVTT